jgi:DNA-binding transcriptional MerR regulator
MAETLDLFEPRTSNQEDKLSGSAKRRRQKKSDNAYRTISEVADSIGVATHVLRFWETKFDEIQPLKRGGGRRYYRPEDIAIIKHIQNLLHNEGYTIKGVQSFLKKEKAQPQAQQMGDTVALSDVLERLYKLRKMLAA